jgi:hypothetical protein
VKTLVTIVQSAIYVCLSFFIKFMGDSVAWGVFRNVISWLSENWNWQLHLVVFGVNSVPWTNESERRSERERKKERESEWVVLYLTAPSMYKVCRASALDEWNINVSVAGMIPTGERWSTREENLTQYQFFPPQILLGLAGLGFNLCGICGGHSSRNKITVLYSVSQLYFSSLATCTEQ